MWTSIMLLKEYFHLPDETGPKPSDILTQPQQTCDQNYEGINLGINEGIHLVSYFHENSILCKKEQWFYHIASPFPLRE